MTLTNLRKYQEEMFLCGRCGDCSLADKTVASDRDVYHPCAVKNVLGFEAYAARGRIMIMNDLLEGRLELNQDIADWAFTCTTCKNCQETCTATAEGIHLPEMMEALRKDLVENGLQMPRHVEIESSIINQGNPYAEPRDQRLALFGEREWPETADIVYFVGCTGAYREKEIAQATVQLFDKIGVNFTVLPDERCCGSVLLRLGRTKSFAELTRHNIRAIERTGAKTLVTACAGCFRTWKIDVKRAGIDYPFRVMHVTELLDQLIQEGRAVFEAPNPARLTYHDPCHLGRHAEVYEAPRRIIQSIKNVTLVEMETNKRYAHCCGSGGGVKSSYGDLAVEVAALRVAEAEATGAEMIVTACPFCHRGLEDGIRHRGSQLRVIDIPNLLLPYYKGAGTGAAVRGSTLKKTFMDYLASHPRIFEGLKKDAVIDYEVDGDRFHVLVRDRGKIEVVPTRAENPDVELIFSNGAVQKLVTFDNDTDYARQFGLFFRHPTKEEWIQFNLRLNVVKLLMKGYRRFAQKAGLL